MAMITDRYDDITIYATSEPRPAGAVFAYTVEQTPDGWVVNVRYAGQEPTEPMGPAYETREEAEKIALESYNKDLGGDNV